MDNDILTLAALVAAYVGVSKSVAAGTRAETLVNRIAPISSLLIAAAFVLAPETLQAKMTLISTIGLAAAGAYSLTKNKTGGGGGQ
ncbi:hypothetical protein [Paenibacillus naphthalenovorans]|uniref:hypothetical protein n=1 Tax=Paenibacillus naphthalenovorans TaxID=162209 RepID=UPI003D2C8D9F